MNDMQRDGIVALHNFWVMYHGRIRRFIAESLMNLTLSGNEEIMLDNILQSGALRPLIRDCACQWVARASEESGRAAWPKIIGY